MTSQPKPLRDWMIVEEITQKRDVDIALPDGVTMPVDESTTFRVISVGEGHYEYGTFIEPKVVAGDVVVLEGLAIRSFTYDERKYKAAQARDVAFVVERLEVVDARD